jgi:hypothetical protein
MRLIGEKPITMMEEPVYGIDEGFRIRGNICYAYIMHLNSDYAVKRQVLKIDEIGKVISSDTYFFSPVKSEPLYDPFKSQQIVNDGSVYLTTTKLLITDKKTMKEPTAKDNVFLPKKYLYL